MKKPDNNSLVIFGASGDLTHRKLIPALFHLFKNGRLADDFAILGVSRTEFTDEQYREKLSDILSRSENIEKSEMDEFFTHVYYQAIDTANVEDYAKVKVRLEEFEQTHHTHGNTLFYLSTPPSLYPVIPACLAAHGLNHQNNGWKRLVVEKPFGYDLASAISLDSKLHQDFDESQIYRIDHYLGKETVQNILVLRFSNGLFEPL